MKKSIQVLILDDDPNLRRSLEDILKIKGFEVTGVGKGRQALEEAGSRDYDVALIDLRLEDMTGLEVLRRIKECSPNTECILLTGYASRDSAIEAVNLGAYYYIKKPYDAESLVLTISRAAEKRQAEISLRDSEARYRRLHESMTDAFVMVDMSGRLLEWNNAYRVMLGYTDDELRQLTYMDLTPSRWHEFEMRIVRDQIIPNGHSEVYEKEYRRRDGTVFPVELRTFMLRNDKGQPEGMWAIVRNISLRKQMEKELMELKEDWARIFHAIGHFTMILDPYQEILAVNQMGERLLGRPANEVVGKRCYEVFHGRGAPPSGCPFFNMRGNGKIATAEMEVETLDRIFMVSCTPLMDDHGNLEKVIHVATDITDRKRAEDALRENEKKYRQLFESVSDALFLVGADAGDILEANKAAEDLFGYSRMELLQMKLPDLSTEPEKTAEGIRTGERLVPLRYYRRKDGAVFPVEITASNFWWRGKEVRIAALRDVTLRIKAEEEKKMLEEQLHQAQKLESVGRLAGGVAHDFNNLLSVILGYGGILMTGLEAEAPSYKALNEIYQAADRAKELTRQLLAFSRKQALELRVVDLNAVINGFDKLLRRLIGEDIRLEIRLAPQDVPVKADTGQLEQVLMNLAVNARDAMPDGGTLAIGTARVFINMPAAELEPGMESGEYALVTVRDTGCGMGLAILDRLFEPFFTTKEEGKGTGLGLATSHGIIKQHGGSIRAESEPGMGATFRIYLPISLDVPEQENVYVGQDDYPPGVETVLLVEDDESLRKLVCNILRRNGYTVYEAENGESALSIMEGHKSQVHLLLTDVVMPGMSGKNLFESIIVNYPQVKVLYMSGYTRDEIEQRGVMEKGGYFIQKPFSMKSLLNKVREVLGR